MSTAIQSIEVNVDVRTAYDQWTQLEAFPRFMDHVVDVEQLDDTHARFTVRLGGREMTYEAEITEQIPDARIAWTSREGRDTGGVVTFHHLDDDRCRVTLQLGYAPNGVLETVADLVGIVERIAKGDLADFKTFIERRNGPTGAWRGEVERDAMHAPHA